jgi:ATP-binding cassette, subfamily B, bacterial
MQSTFSIARVLRPHWKALLVAFVAVLFESLADLVEPWPIKIVLDYVVGSKLLPHWLSGLISLAPGSDKQAVLNFAVMLVIAVALVGAVSSYTEDYLTTKVGQWVMHDLRHDLYHHIQRLSFTDYDRQRTGDLISRITSDIDAIQDFASSALLGIVIDLVTLVGMLIIMFSLNWRFTLIALAVAPLLFLEVYSLTLRSKRATRAVRKKQGEIVAVAQESLSSLRVVQAFGQEDYEEEKLERETLEGIRMALSARKIKARLSPIVDVIVAIGTCIVLWYGARLVMAGDLTPGALVVFVIYLGKMYKPMRDLSKMADVVSKALVGAERVNEIVKIRSSVRNLPGARRAPRFKGSVAFENVSFGYEKDQIVLRKVNLEIQAGQFVAIVGPTGGGKSTVVSLVPRFYDPVSGSVKIDGVDIRKYKLESLRKQISFVLQETILFHAPIWQNIAYGKPDATQEEIVRAAKLSNAHDFIKRMPQGYQTMVGERGASLSGGQRQRLAIARAIIRETPILILDEPSSGLDAAAEQLVFDALARLMQGRTSIVVAHRLATVKNADKIYVMDEGAVVESGTHDQLMARNGLYAHLYQIQFHDDELTTGVTTGTPYIHGDD